MDQNIKQRLVGIAVSFALEVIFLPMILDGAGVRDKTLKVEIPEQPVIVATPEFDQKIVELHAKVDELPDLEPRFVDETSSEDEKLIKREDVEPAVAKVVPKTEPEPEVTPKKPVGGQSWVLQVGSFHDRSKALSQRDKLRKSKIAAVFIEKFNKNNQISYRVRLGPFIDRDQSVVAQNKVRAKYNINGLIMKNER
ncbi:MAG: hypothetical protein GY763_13520 [Gammaproteobacteria bacterium]|nr:hypothetical protein [Gammaproteobacteria bacterium]